MGHPELQEVVADRHSKWVAIPDRHDQQLRRRRYYAPNVGRGVSEEVLPRPARLISPRTGMAQTANRTIATVATRPRRFVHIGQRPIASAMTGADSPSSATCGG